MVHRVATIDNEWQRTTTSDKNDNEYNTTNDSVWQRGTTNDSKWQQVVKLMKMVQYTSKNGWLPFFLWLIQGIDGCN